MDIRYFMNECTLWEIENIIDCIPWCDRNLWDSQRMNAFLIGKANFKGIKDFKDICKLPWDTQFNLPKEITNEEIAELEEFAKNNLSGKIWQDN